MPAAPKPAPTPLSSDPIDGQWLVWQLADSAFPTGGFAHSSGLEAALQQGELRDPAQLSHFIQASLCQLGHCSLPFVASAHSQPSTLSQLDCLFENYSTNHVANRASRLQGRAFLKAAQHVWAESQPHLPPQSQINLVRYGHLAPIFGFVLRAFRVELVTTCRLYLFFHLRGLISAAVRLGVVGPLQAQSLQNRLAAAAEQVRLQCQNLALDEVAQTAPLLEIWQANQDRLYSRLFLS
jgi:urease accessory protein